MYGDCCCGRRRRRDVAVAQQRLHHLQQYHMKGNPVGNGSVTGTTAEHVMTSRSTLQSTLPATCVAIAHHPREVDQDSHQSLDGDRHQRRSHINGDVFYVSGKPNTSNVADDTMTFTYFTYDRDYFHERQKVSCLQDRNLRHSMQ